MKRLVLKFGGTSVGTIDKIKKVANIIKNRHSEDSQIIVVVSAMSGVTDELKIKSGLIIAESLLFQKFTSKQKLRAYLKTQKIMV